jgi:integrase
MEAQRLTDALIRKVKTPAKGNVLYFDSEIRSTTRTMRAESIDKHLFPGRRGPVQTTLKTCWRRVCAQAGLQSVRLHDVRHTTASLIASGGGSLMAVQDLLGHRDPTTSRRYAHLFDSVQRQIVESVGAQIVGSGTVGGGRYDGAPEASRA